MNTPSQKPPPRPLSFDNCPLEFRKTIISRVLALLSASGFAPRKRWAHACVLPEEKRATSRGCLAGWLYAHALPTLARQVSRRSVPPGHVLIFFNGDALCELVLVNLDHELERMRAATTVVDGPTP